MTISPNPFIDHTILSLNNYNGKYSVSLNNSIGELTRSYKNVSGEFVLYKSGLAAGLYLLTIVAHGKFIEKKVVVD